MGLLTLMLIDKVPWKLIVHLALVFFTTLEVLSLDDIYTAHSRHQQRVFKYILLV